MNNGVKFSGTFIIGTSYSDLTRLKSVANPDSIEGYNYKPGGLFKEARDVLVIRNESIEKDQKVLSWLEGFSSAPWSHYNPVMVTSERAKQLISAFLG